LEDATTATPTPEPEARPKRRRAAVSNRSVLFQDDMDDDTDGEPKKKAKRGRKPKSAIAVLDEFATPLPTPPITEIDSFPIPDPIQLWSGDDKALFLDLLAQHGENFKRIAVAMPNKTSVQVAEYFKANYAELDLGSVSAKAKGSAAGDVSISALTSPIEPTFSSAPSPSASMADRPVDGSAEPSSNPPPQNADIDASPILDPKAMWDSMDPGSGARSPTTDEPPERVSTGSETSSSDLSVAGHASGSASRSAPPMASLTREASVDTTSGVDANSNRPPLQSLKIPASTSADQHAAKSEASENDPVLQASSFEQPKYPAMSSLTYDPIWGGYYDPNSANRPMFAPPNHYPEGGAPTRPYSPSGPVPYATPIHPPPRPPVGAIGSRPPPMTSYAVPYPYYIPPPYPSTSYHPYSSYKS